MTKTEDREKARKRLVAAAGGVYCKHQKLAHMVQKIPEETAKKVVGEVEAIVKKEADGVKEHIDTALDKKFQQYFGQPAREGETFTEAKARLKAQRALEDVALKNGEAQRLLAKKRDANEKKEEERNAAKAKAKGRARRGLNYQTRVEIISPEGAVEGEGAAEGEQQAQPASSTQVMSDALTHLEER